MDIPVASPGSMFNFQGVPVYQNTKSSKHGDSFKRMASGRPQDWPFQKTQIWVVATQICFIFTPKIGEMIRFD